MKYKSVYRLNPPILFQHLFLDVYLLNIKARTENEKIFPTSCSTLPGVQICYTLVHPVLPEPNANSCVKFIMNVLFRLEDFSPTDRPPDRNIDMSRAGVFRQSNKKLWLI